MSQPDIAGGISPVGLSNAVGRGADPSLGNVLPPNFDFFESPSSVAAGPQVKPQEASDTVQFSQLVQLIDGQDTGKKGPFENMTEVLNGLLFGLKEGKPGEEADRSKDPDQEDVQDSKKPAKTGKDDDKKKKKEMEFTPLAQSGDSLPQGGLIGQIRGAGSLVNTETGDTMQIPSDGMMRADQDLKIDYIAPAGKLKPGQLVLRIQMSDGSKQGLAFLPNETGDKDKDVQNLREFLQNNPKASNRDELQGRLRELEGSRGPSEANGAQTDPGQQVSLEDADEQMRQYLENLSPERKKYFELLFQSALTRSSQNGTPAAVEMSQGILKDGGTTSIEKRLARNFINADNKKFGSHHNTQAHPSPGGLAAVPQATSTEGTALGLGAQPSQGGSAAAPQSLTAKL
ncbi:MAG: hypothetical protein HYU64_15165 [Armatimonadetes bacterium]|nr:hypothetical protein [Armatimonadota bacterium]